MHPSEPAEEFLQCYNEYGHPTQGRPRSVVKSLPYRYWYGVTKIWVVNDKAELMVSRRAETLSGNPGKWQTYFGGHVAMGMSFHETAVKELAEEAGLRVRPDELFLIAKGRNDTKKNFFEMYTHHFNGQPHDLHFVDGEVTAAKWMSMEEYWAEQEQFPEQWCNSCALEFQDKIRAWLKAIA